MDKLLPTAFHLYPNPISSGSLKKHSINRHQWQQAFCAYKFAQSIHMEERNWFVDSRNWVTLSKIKQASIWLSKHSISFILKKLLLHCRLLRRHLYTQTKQESAFETFTLINAHEPKTFCKNKLLCQIKNGKHPGLTYTRKCWVIINKLL